MIDGLKRGKWVAGRTIGTTMRATSTERAMREDEWLSLSDFVEECANRAVDEAVHAALAAAATFVERACSGSDDENIIEAGPRWGSAIRALYGAEDKKGEIRE